MKPRIKEVKPYNTIGIGHGVRAFEVTLNGETRHIELGAWRGFIDGKFYDQALDLLRRHVEGWVKNPDSHIYCNGIHF
jgi:hypothetical protein